MLLERMVMRTSVCLRRLGGERAGEVRFGRFLANDKVTVEALVAGWARSARAAGAACCCMRCWRWMPTTGIAWVW